jgi:hypothetical protein
VTSIAAPGDYSFRQIDALLHLAQRETTGGSLRTVRLPGGTRPGFLSALADLIHEQVERSQIASAVQATSPIKYVYYGRIYELRATRVRMLPKLLVGQTAYRRVIAADFEICSTYDGELTAFSMTYGVEGPVAEVPLTVSYQPRWWLQVDLALDARPVTPLGDGANP